jgi:hypothetical protein
MCKFRACYTAKFKLEVFLYTQKHGYEAVGRRFDVDEMNIR